MDTGILYYEICFEEKRSRVTLRVVLLVFSHTFFCALQLPAKDATRHDVDKTVGTIPTVSLVMGRTSAARKS